jgi:excisionase family DNA binding protein
MQSHRPRTAADHVCERPNETASPQRGPAEPLQVSIREAARLMAYDERTIRRLIDRGEIISAGQGRLRRVLMASLRAYQDRTRSRSPHAV